MQSESPNAVPMPKDVVGGSANAEFRVKFVDLPRYITMWENDVGSLEGKRVLEIGCGAGITACGMALHTRAALVHAVDINNEHRALSSLLATNTVLSTHPANLQFESIIPGQVAAEDCFDFVYSWSVFEHIDLNLLPNIIRQIHGKLNDDGHMFVQIAPLYFSPEEAHLWRSGYLNWEHLSKELAHVHRDIFSREDMPHEEKVKLWNMYATLNRLTADDLVRHVTACGFRLVKEKRDRIKHEPPPHLLNAYCRDALTTFQITALFKKE